MFVNVDMREIALITSESTQYEFSAAIFIELLKFWYKVVTIVLECMRMPGNVSGAQLAGKREGGVLPYPFLKIKKIALIMGKNALIAFIDEWYVHLCSHLKYHFKSI